jgi:hypothetical protein
MTHAIDLRPRLSSIDAAIDKLRLSSVEVIPLDIEVPFRDKCTQMRDHVMRSYDKYIDGMRSVDRLIGTSDREIQAKQSQGMEIWYDRAVDTLIEACLRAKNEPVSKALGDLVQPMLTD